MAIVTPEEFYANFTSDVQSIFCYKAVQTTSPGIWLANNPLMFPFPLLLFQLTLIFIFTRITQSILSHLSIPIHISQIIGGIILGPSCIGRYEPFEKIMYSAHGWEQLNLISSYAIFFFFFIIGLKTDLSMISKTGKKAIAIAISSAIIPFTAIILTIHFSNNRLPPRFKERFVILNALIPWTTTSCIVISSTLADLNLLTSKLGRLAMSASLITEFANLFIRAALDSYLLMKKHHSVTIGVTSMSANLGFMVFLVFIARPVTIRAIRRTPEGSMLDEKSFIGVLGLAMVCGLITDVIGARPFVGPFFLGLVLPGGAPLGVTMVEKLGRLVEGVLCPVFLALAGIRMDVGSLKMGNVEWKVLLLFLIIVVLGEFLGAMMPCFYCQMPVRDCVAVGLMVISKGILEAATACRLQDQKTGVQADLAMSWDDLYAGLKDGYTSIQRELQESQESLTIIKGRWKRDITRFKQMRDELHADVAQLRTEADAEKEKTEEVVRLRTKALNDVARLEAEVTRLSSQELRDEVEATAIAEYKGSLEFAQDRLIFADEVRGEIWSSEVEPQLEDAREVAFRRGAGKAFCLVARVRGADVEGLGVDDLSEDESCATDSDAEE